MFLLLLRGTTKRTFSTSFPRFTVEKNPLLSFDKQFPNFQVLPQHVTTGVESLLDQASGEFSRLEHKLASSWECTLEPLQKIEGKVENVASLVKHLGGVRNSSELRKAIEQVQPKLVEFGLQINQSKPLLKALESIDLNQLDAAQQRAVKLRINNMRNSGIGLEGSDKVAKFNHIQQRLSELSLKFSNNVLDGIKQYGKVITRQDELKGCPERLLKSMKAAAARQRGSENEEWLVTLDHPTLIPFMEYCENRSLREELYLASITVASKDPINNSPILHERLALLQEKAQILGFPDYAHLSLSEKMAKTPSQVWNFIDNLHKICRPTAYAQLQELRYYAAKELDITDLKPWDMAYVRRSFRETLFEGFDNEMVAQYFPQSQVMQGLITIAKQVFNIDVVALNPGQRLSLGINTWHPDVQVYQVEEEGKPIAYFYADFYCRPEEKTSGAWMDICTTRERRSSELILPIAYLICNQNPPTTDTESLLSFREVTTLFHEFGHCLQHMLTKVDLPQVSGLNGIEWDFIEVASQFMENFCYEPDWIKLISRHHKTGEALPEKYIKHLPKQRKYMNGLDTLRQLQFSATDLALHSKEMIGTDAFQVDHDMAKKYSLMPKLPEDRFLCSFQHIFAGGYSAGYYSYKWSEAYSADAYRLIQQDDLSRKKYRNLILGCGGALEAAQVWQLYSGREGVDLNALLKQEGFPHSN